METKWKWTPVAISKPFDDQLVAIKFVDSGGSVFYGMGYHSARQSDWVFTAPPLHADNIRPLAWMALPE